MNTHWENLDHVQFTNRITVAGYRVAHLASSMLKKAQNNATMEEHYIIHRPIHAVRHGTCCAKRLNPDIYQYLDEFPKVSCAPPTFQSEAHHAAGKKRPAVEIRIVVENGLGICISGEDTRRKRPKQPIKRTRRACEGCREKHRGCDNLLPKCKRCVKQGIPCQRIPSTPSAGSAQQLPNLSATKEQNGENNEGDDLFCLFPSFSLRSFIINGTKEHSLIPKYTDFRQPLDTQYFSKQSSQLLQILQGLRLEQTNMQPSPRRRHSSL
ncbi:hypothetical protein BC936DRAFT_140717 [Jimgerdemannia flammicorona]|uniref:Zn(2)-C6 fungal-type domain-containing protein n=1 Tax=Jimgerdemannia flammicorona TaxID=994334 RepID=A0A433DGM6_9FUNG|nr:hypothetical protein BC936DRAFT_140717 [Jimgerdemannia flammicorona]